MHLPILLMTAADGKLPGWVFPLQILGFFGIFYWFLIRPQGQARKKHEEHLSTMKAGDEVMTVGGIIGRVKKVEEKNGEWRVTIESGTSTVVVERSRIHRLGDKSAPQS